MSPHEPTRTAQLEAPSAWAEELPLPSAAVERAVVAQQAVVRAADRLRFSHPGLWAVVALWIATFLLLSPAPQQAFEQHWPLFFLGMAGATIGNATAVGGGLVFVPATMWLYNLDALTSLKLALGCQAFGMTSGALSWWRRGLMPQRELLYGLPALAVGCAIGGLWLRPEAALVKVLFGPVSVAIGVSTLLFAMRPQREPVMPAVALVGVLACALLGSLLTAWVAIGVGEVVAAYLMMRWGVRAEVGIALGVGYLSLCSIMLAALHALSGGLPWTLIAFMGLGCILGARLGPVLSQYVPERVIKLTFAVIAISDGTLFVVQYGLR